MDPVLPSGPSLSPDKLDVKLSFRKPSNDATNRKYRRHSPVGGSDSSSSGGSPKRGRSHSPAHSMDDHSRMPDDRRRKIDGGELERETSRYQSSRGSESQRHSYRARATYRNSHDYQRHNNYRRHERQADEEEMSCQRFSESGRESRSGNSDRSRDRWRYVDKYTRDRSENLGHRSMDKERETVVQEHSRHWDRDSEIAVSRKRQINYCKDDTGVRERHGDGEARDGRRDCRRSPDHKNDHVSSHNVVRGRNIGSLRSKEIHRSSNDEMDGQKDELVQKSKHDGRNERYVDKTSSWNVDQISSTKRLQRGKSKDEKPSSSSKQVVGTAEIVISKPVNSISNQADAANDLDAAKDAAIKAAELVNKNLVGGGGSYLSTDQKKKLLWGGKKSATAEEPSNRWGLQLFSDGDRQEKFNKLMGVKSIAVPQEHEDGSLRAEKQMELNMDLEKQYSAGLRRRDGRTVGLGL